MSAKLGFLVLAVTVATSMGLRGALIEQRQPTESSLKVRAEAYYASLTKRHFDDTWTFFTAQNRADNTPREKYSKVLQESKTVYESAVVHRITLQEPSQAEKASGSRVATVTAVVKLAIATEKLEQLHVTTWRWQSIDSAPADWYLHTQEFRAVPKTTTASEIDR